MNTISPRLEKLLSDTKNYLNDLDSDQKGTWHALIEQIKVEIVRDKILCPINPSNTQLQYVLPETKEKEKYHIFTDTKTHVI